MMWHLAVCCVTFWKDEKPLCALVLTDTFPRSLAPSQGTGSVGWCQAEGNRNGRSTPNSMGSEDVVVVVGYDVSKRAIKQKSVKLFKRLKGAVLNLYRYSLLALFSFFCRSCGHCVANFHLDR